jgi:hypothetical protein
MVMECFLHKKIGGSEDDRGVYNPYSTFEYFIV